MKDKETIITDLENRLKEMFVDDFDKVNDARNNINNHLINIEVNNKYEYNEFCADFLRITEKLLNSLSVEDIETIDFTFIMGEILSIMIKYKIFETETDEKTRLQKLIHHELKIRNLGYNNLS